MKNLFVLFVLIITPLACFAYGEIGVNKTIFDVCSGQCRKPIKSEEDIKCIRECYYNQLSEVCDKKKTIKVNCQCINDKGSLKPHCNYCCDSPKMGVQKFKNSAKKCSDVGWNKQIVGKKCTRFGYNKPACPDCEKCFEQHMEHYDMDLSLIHI